MLIASELLANFDRMRIVHLLEHLFVGSNLPYHSLRGHVGQRGHRGSQSPTNAPISNLPVRLSFQREILPSPQETASTAPETLQLTRQTVSANLLPSAAAVPWGSRVVEDQVLVLAS